MHAGVFLACHSFVRNIFGFSISFLSHLWKCTIYQASIPLYFRLYDLAPRAARETSSKTAEQMHQQSESHDTEWVTQEVGGGQASTSCCTWSLPALWASVSVWAPSRSHNSLYLSNNWETLGTGSKSYIMQNANPGSIGLFLHHKYLELQSQWD